MSRKLGYPRQNHRSASHRRAAAYILSQLELETGNAHVQMRCSVDEGA